ncbi:hypothetical protein QP185_07860 [Sphingomonas aerolata]|uniref:hypothetical protein n=1 Tax=Sphingomonas aerolata TaxID=185951 RepID=UPI002FE2227D
MALLALLAKLTERQRTRLRYARPTLLDGRNWYPLDWTNMFHKRLCNRLRTDRRILPIEVGRTSFRTPRSSPIGVIPGNCGLL